MGYAYGDEDNLGLLGLARDKVYIGLLYLVNIA
jgi:hypothetical protein